MKRMTRLTRPVAATVTALVGAGLLLAGCSGAPTTEVAGSSWLVTDIWTLPGEPSTLPPHAAGTAQLAFGGQSVTGTTGCARLQGTVAFTRDGATASATDADTLRIDRLETEPAPADCASAWVHENLVDIITPGATFDVHRSGRSLVLTLQGEGVDRPAVGLSAM